MATRRTQATAQAPAATGSDLDMRHVRERIARERAADPELGAYLARTDAYPLLSAAEEKRLAQRLEADPDDKAARDRLITANLRLVATVAACYTGHGMPLLELISYGNIGLCEAVTTYDYRRGRFSTHATWQIRYRVSRNLANLGDTIRTSRRMAELQREIRALEAEGGEMSDRELARRLQSSPAAIRRARACSEAPVSLDMHAGRGNHSNTAEHITLADTIPDTSPEPEERAIEALDTPVMRAALARSLATLAPRDRQIIALRFSDGLSYPAIGARLGMSHEAIRNAVNRILATLRAGLEDGGNTRITQALPRRRAIGA